MKKHYKILKHIITSKKKWLKTVINRAAKRYINTSTDSNLFKYAQESEQRQRKDVLDAEVEEQANQEELDFEQPQQYEDAQFKVEESEPADVSNFEEVLQEAPKQARK